MQTGQINQQTPTLCQSISLLSETKSKASPRGLSCSEHGFTIINYPKIISVPSTAEFTSAVFAGGLIAAALAALQNKSWGCSKVLIATTIQQGVINLQPNTQKTLFDLAQSAISQHRPQLGRESRQTRPGIQKMWARTGIRVALGKTAMPRADRPGFSRHHPSTNRCFLLFPHPSMMSDTAWMQHPTYSFISSPTLSGDCIGANF